MVAGDSKQNTKQSHANIEYIGTEWYTANIQPMSGSNREYCLITVTVACSNEHGDGPGSTADMEPGQPNGFFFFIPHIYFVQYVC